MNRSIYEKAETFDVSAFINALAVEIGLNNIRNIKTTNANTPFKTPVYCYRLIFVSSNDVNLR